MARVAYVAWAFPVTTQTFTVREIAALRDRGIDVTVFTARSPRGEALDEDAERERALAVVLPPIVGFRTLGSVLAWALRRPFRTAATFLRSLGGTYADRPLSHRLRAPAHVAAGAAMASRVRSMGGFGRIHAQFLDAGSTAGWAAARLLDLPFSFANHTAYNPFLAAVKCRDADRVVCISEHDRATLAAQAGWTAPPPHFAVSRVGIRLAEWSGLARRPEPRRVLVVAALREKKGHRVLLAASALLARRGAPVRLVFAGAGPCEADLRAEAARLGADVEFLGAVPPSGVRAETARAAVACLPCVRAANGDVDGIPVALMEAMAAGVPVVSTRISGIPELVEDGETGHLAEPGVAESLADALDRALGPRGEALADAARAAVAARHDLLRTSEGLAAILAGNAR
ncbi:MAG: hypothetical protein HMLKMBBP_03927 [Planctomycetes bacterium]|nr:hypothetical protein [Planctomycetota bacterium]